jgi:hypothetical protein
MLQWLGFGRRQHRAISDNFVEVHGTQNSPIHKLDYLPLSTSTDEIRLLTIIPSYDMSRPISCTLEHEKFSDNPTYESLSYTWGSPDGPKPTIYVDSKPMTIRENLWFALKEMRDCYNPRTLWIDAVCIDQDNIDERTRQVRIMPFIYRRATKVLVWLGPEDSEVSEVLSKLGSNSLDAIRNSVDLRLQIGRLCRRDYWRRLWIIQEVEVAVEILVCCGSTKIGWDTFIKAVELCRSLDLSIPIQMARNRKDRYGDSHQLANLLKTYQSALCENPRDKVFGLVGLANDIVDDSALVDYKKSPKEIFREVVQLQYHSEISLHDVPPHDYPIGTRTNMLEYSRLVRNLFGNSFVGPITPEPSNQEALNTSEPADIPIKLGANLLGAVQHVGPLLSEVIGSFDKTKEWGRTILKDVLVHNKAIAKEENDGFTRSLLGVSASTVEKLAPLRSGFSWLANSRGNHVADPMPRYMSQYQPMKASYDQATGDPSSNHEPRLFLAGLFVLGLAPYNVRIGDLICCLCDDPTTLVVRKVEDRYLIVGRTLVYHTNLSGEGKELVPRGPVKGFVPGVYVDVDTLEFLSS